jgi:glucosamine--fructose-6-phosphate aminotransferase (isomerizing)
MTKTYASTLTAAHLLLMAYFGAAEKSYQAVSQAADCAEEAIDAAERIIPGILSSLADFEHAFHFGAGVAYAASLETALKMKEMALLHAEGAETWEMASGPATVVSPASFCVALTSGGSTDTETVRVTSHTRAWGAPVIEIGPQPSLQAEAGVWHIPVRAPVFEPLASLVLVPPAALLAYRLARARGFDPDQPNWRERYTSQGMTHIIGE